MSNKNVMCGVAGASGGHIIPGVIFLQNIAQKEDAGVLFFSTKSHFDQSILRYYETNFTYCSLPIVPIPGKKIWRYPIFVYRALQAFIMSFSALRRHRPLRVVSMGGFISVPVCFAAWVLRIKVQLFELNAVPGKAIRWLAPLADTIFVCFPEAAHFLDPRKVRQVSYPLRFQPSDRMTQSEARAKLSLSLDKTVLLVIGGSQGSQALNALVKGFFSASFDNKFAVIHQTGSGGAAVEAEYRAFYKERGIEAVVFAYTHELNICYEAADLVISRAGAGSVFELAFFSKRSILIPLEVSAEAHQLENAQAIMKQYSSLFSLVRQHAAENDPTVLARAIESMSPKN